MKKKILVIRVAKGNFKIWLKNTVKVKIQNKVKSNSRQFCNLEILKHAF